MIDEKRLNEILERHRPKLLAMDSSTLVHPRTNRVRALALTSTLVENFRPIALEDELSAARARQSQNQLDGLEERALAYFAADLACEESGSGEQSRRSKLSTRAAEHNRYLLKWAWPLFGDERDRVILLSDIQHGTGFQDDAEDVLRLVELFRSLWQEAAGKTPVTLKFLDQAEANATELVTLLDAKANDKKRELAWRAYTAWSNDYSDLMKLGRYLLRHTRGVEDMFPGISRRRAAASRRQSSPADSGSEADGGIGTVAMSDPMAALDATDDPQVQANATTSVADRSRGKNTA
ncbi:MAG: hypothetical protein MJE77_22135 [Proteobacteria bacterium]|nr:hypothetical protein [Pseudomonadota bacterium]